MFKYILFDLDGTLTDSSKGIINCVKYAMDAAGVTIENDDDLFEFIGPPLTDGFMTILGMNREEAERATTKFRERYNVTGLFENEPYVLAVATSKPEETAKRILEHFELAKYFDEIVGSSVEENRNTKQAVIEEVLKRLNIIGEEKQSVLMTGDRRHDVIGAHACGIKALGVYYGFAKEGELEEAGAEYIVNEVKGILDLEELKLLLNKQKQL